MAITYPRTIPSTRISSVYFEPEPQEANSGEQGGRFISTMLGPTLWAAKFSTECASEVEFSRWRAWLDSLDGSGREFFAYDVRRPLPWNYRRGFVDANGNALTRAVSGGAFNGTSTAWEANTARDEITIGDGSGQQLPVGLQLIEGDYIELRKNNFRSLHRCMESYSANSSGVGIWTVRPYIHPDVAADWTVNLIKASCRMVVTGRDRDAEHKSRRVAFEAKQNLEFE
jgi:hypothetical protein